MEVENEVVEPGPAQETAEVLTETGPGEVAQEEAKPAKTFTQDELDNIVKREKAKAEAKADRRALKAYQETLERALPKSQPQEQAKSDRPRQDQFADVDDYVEAMADWKLAQREKQTQEAKAQEEFQKTEEKKNAIFKKASKDPSFDADHFLSLPLSEVVRDAILDSDVPEKLITYLNANPDLTKKIYSLGPARQAAEIGKIEVKLSAEPAKSKAPAPITPIGTGAGKASKNLNDMTDEEYAQWREQGRK